MEDAASHTEDVTAHVEDATYQKEVVIAKTAPAHPTWRLQQSPIAPAVDDAEDFMANIAPE